MNDEDFNKFWPASKTLYGSAISDVARETFEAQRQQQFYSPYIPISPIASGQKMYVKRFVVPDKVHTASLMTQAGKPVELEYKEEIVPVSELTPQERYEFMRRRTEAQRAEHDALVLRHIKETGRKMGVKPPPVEPPVSFLKKLWTKIRNFKLEIPLDGPEDKPKVD